MVILFVVSFFLIKYGRIIGIYLKARRIMEEESKTERAKKYIQMYGEVIRGSMGESHYKHRMKRVGTNKRRGNFVKKE